MNTRDLFISELYKIAHQDNDVFFISTDLGSPSLDAFRKNLAGQFLNVGIAEQNAILVASGIALTGKRSYVYGLAQFLVLRAFEQARIYPAGMKLDVTLLGTSVGVANDVAGPTHYVVEDIALMRILPNMQIWSVSSENMAKAFARMSYEVRGPKYIRFDNEALPEAYSDATDFTQKIHTFGDASDTCLIACGSMLRIALEAQKILEKKGACIRVADAAILPLSGDEIKSLRAKNIYVLEEHTLPGGLGSHILELVSDNDIQVKTRRIGFDFSKGYYRGNGNRNQIFRECKMDAEAVAEKILEEV
jgi:transketolase